MEKDFALELYKLYRTEMYESYKLHRETLQNYLAFTTAVLAATIAGILQLRNIGWIGIVTLVGPILNVFVCILATRVCDRFYLGILDLITTINKLEAVLGLQDPITWKSTGQDEPPYSKDIYVLPERWIKSRYYSSSEEFIKRQRNAGVNRLAKLTFYLLIGFNILLGIAILLAVTL